MLVQEIAGDDDNWGSLLREPNRAQGNRGWGRTRKLSLSRAHKSNQCRAVCGKVLRQCLIGGRASVYLEFAASALNKSAPRPRGRRKSLSIIDAADGPPRLRALHRAEDIGSALKRGVNVCQRHLVNEVLGPLVTEFVRNFGREGATPIQHGPNASLLGRVQAVKLIRHNALPDI
jgi:hypothetical protein